MNKSKVFQITCNAKLPWVESMVDEQGKVH